MHLSTLKTDALAVYFIHFLIRSGLTVKCDLDNIDELLERREKTEECIGNMSCLIDETLDVS